MVDFFQKFKDLQLQIQKKYKECISKNMIYYAVDNDYFSLLNESIELCNEHYKEFNLSSLKDKILFVYSNVLNRYFLADSMLYRMTSGMKDFNLDRDKVSKEDMLFWYNEALQLLLESIQCLDYLYNDEYYRMRKYLFSLEDLYTFVYTDIKIICSIINYQDTERVFIEGLKNSPYECSSALMQYYIDNNNVSSVLDYYEIYKETLTDNHNNDFELISIIYSLAHLSRFLCDNGSYNKAIEVNKFIIEYVEEHLLDFEKLKSNCVYKFNIEELDGVDILNPNATISVCKDNINFIESKIRELNNINFNYSIIEQYFPKSIIDRMSDDIKIYINTSIGIYNLIEQEKIIYDYSACLMPIMKAVESILYIIIIENYLPYLKKLENIDFKYIDEHFIFNRFGQSVIRDNIDRIEYGTALHAIGYTSHFNNEEIININRYFFDFCKVNNVENVYNTISNIYKRLKVINIKRNKVAHRNRITKDDAKITYDYLLENYHLIKDLYNVFKFCFV